MSVGSVAVGLLLADLLRPDSTPAPALRRPDDGVCRPSLACCLKDVDETTTLTAVPDSRDAICATTAMLTVTGGGRSIERIVYSSSWSFFPHLPSLCLPSFSFPRFCSALPKKPSFSAFSGDSSTGAGSAAGGVALGLDDSVMGRGDGR